MTAAAQRMCSTLDPELGDEINTELLGYFVPASEHLRNDTGLPITSASFPGRS